MEIYFSVIEFYEFIYDHSSTFFYSRKVTERMKEIEKAKERKNE